MITELSLNHFRCLGSLEVGLGRRTVITGNNGAGKTSILEAVRMLSLTTSWRTERDSEVVTWGEPVARLSGRITGDDAGELQMVVQASPYIKRMKVDGVAKRAGEVMGIFPTVLFQPDDLQLMYGAPAGRRQYLDRLLAQTSRPYTEGLVRLQHVLKQRNRLLKRIGEESASEAELPFWDQQLAELQAIFKPVRERFLAYITERLPAHFAKLVPVEREIQVRYLRSPTTEPADFAQHLASNRLKEIVNGSSLYGPHREDFSVTWGGVPVEAAMSRGQLRALVFSLKLLEVSYLADELSQTPTFLLDDVFSELDESRRIQVFEQLQDGQVILSGVEQGQVFEEATLIAV